jgi:hypothetical protein
VVINQLAQIVLFRRTRLPPELKIEKSFNTFSSETDLGIFIFKGYSLGGPLPKLLKWFRSAEQDGHQS